MANANVSQLGTAIKQVLDNYKKTSDNEPKKIDVQMFIVNCTKILKDSGLPYYSIKQDEDREYKVVFQVPFLETCHITFESFDFHTPDIAAILYINGQAVRKVKLESFKPEYLKKIGEALLDYLKRFLLLKNKFETPQ